MGEQRHFRKSFGDKGEVRPILEQDYHSGVIEWLRANGHRLEHGQTTILLAREFGFCYGVDRAVEYAYETRRRFPDRRVFITGEIIHNPWVNQRLAEMEIERLPATGTIAERIRGLRTEDVVLIPAFGIEQPLLEHLREIGAILVDTTCGSVLNVWKSVGRYAREGITAIIHGKYAHEETRATCSQVLRTGGAYLVVRDPEETAIVCDYIRGRGDREAFIERFRPASSDGFDPDRDLAAIGLANQTTMLSSESIRISEMLRDSLLDRYGKAAIDQHFRSFDTICSATQDRQDAVVELLKAGIDLLIVIGGFNSSNTGHLVEIGLESHVPTYHVQRAEDLLTGRWIRHKPAGDPDPVVSGHWLPPGRAVIGITAGASTPNNETGRTIQRLLELRGVENLEFEATTPPEAAR
jgi:4-hydroxy-3-methylbut-2-enyl diphosphate reductase